MSIVNNPPPDFEKPLTSQSEIDECMEKICSQEQVYSIALFDVLGFSNFVESHGNQAILDLYNKLLDLINRQKSTISGQESIAGSVVPTPTSEDWKHNNYIANANGYVNVCHFSDTFLIYVNYQLSSMPFWLRSTKYEPYPLLLEETETIQHPIMYHRHHIYLSFLQTCMDFFCQSIVAGIPLRGCISTGLAVMNPYKSIYLGSPLVEAARGETAQNSIGIAFGKSFNNSHPVYNDYFIPYLDHIKEKNGGFLSPMMLDWARYWRNSAYFNKFDVKECISKMNNDPNFSSYYDNAIKFYDFSAKHKNWSEELNRDGIKNIYDYYIKANEWYKSVMI